MASSHLPTEPPPRRRNPWLWAGLAGCAGLLCLAALGIGAALLLREGRQVGTGLVTAQAPTTEAAVSQATPVEATATGTSAPTPEPTATAEVVEATEATRAPSATATRASTNTPTPIGRTSTPTSAPERGEPTIGAITFAAAATDDNQPVDASTTFPEDTQEIHAVFDYAGMSEELNWERRWYQNGEEVSAGSGIWDAGEEGAFDLSLSGGGEPLGSGSWELELYVEGELAQSGRFVIVGSPTPTSAPVTAARKIAFARWDGGEYNLYTANTDGSGEQFILQRAAGPSWGPNGRSLYVYGREGVDQQVRDGNTFTWPEAGISNGVLFLDLTTMSNGIPDAFQHSTWKEGTARAVALAPNGGMLAYDATHGSPDRRIYFLGTAENQQFAVEIPGEHPSWSPDSNQIVYRSGRNGAQGIWISNRDDSGAHTITNDGSDAFPAWSPDGKTIAFHRESGGNVDIYAMNVDGSNVRRLTDAAGPDTLPAWTPDGRLVFRSARSGAWGIYLMNGDGSEQRQIIANADPGSDWSFGRMDVY
jgi:hypothetical protein